MVEIAQYHVYDLRFTARVAKNPYDVDLRAVWTAPDGSTLTIPGFYDGDDTWVIRFSPMQLGEWSYETRSDISSLDSRRGRGIFCVPNANPHIHGPLRVDREHPHHFVYADGTRYFPLGDECDWLFALDMADARRYLDRLAAYGFNQVLMQVYAHHASWSEGLPFRVVPQLFPWEGSNEHPHHSRLNPPFWQHLDEIIAYMQQRGIVAHLMIEVHNKHVNWPARTLENDNPFWRHVIARYQAFGNVIWDLCKEIWRVDDAEYWESRVELLRRLDAYHHLITAHDGVLERGDFLADQHHEAFHAHILQERARRAWPVMNVEYGYEPGPIPTYPMITLPDEMRCRTWEIVAAGGYPVFYYGNTAWDVVDLAPLPEGYPMFHIVQQVMARLPYWEMEPYDSLVDNGYCLAKLGEAYLVYLPHGGRVRLMAGELRGAGRPHAFWVNPRTGVEIPAGPLRPGANSFMAPLAFGHGDAVLVAYIA